MHATAQRAVSPPFIHIERVLAELRTSGVQHCVLRGLDNPDCVLDYVREVDVLISPHHMGRARTILQPAGFIQQPAPGHAPHLFFLKYCDGYWCKLDLVTDLRYGRTARVLKAASRRDVLANAQQINNFSVPSPSDEFALLLLHSLLDKNEFPPRHRTRLALLWRRLTEEAEAEVAKQWRSIMSGAIPWSAVMLAASTEDWESLLTYRAAAARTLFWRDAMGTAARWLSATAQRCAGRLISGQRGTYVVLLAPDGAGKTTLANQLAADAVIRARTMYMGHHAVNSVPGHGSRFGHLAAKVVSFSRLVACHWRDVVKARLLKLRGRIVVFDRFHYDSLLNGKSSTYRLRVRRWLLNAGCPHPDLVLILDAPGEVLYGRKGEHDPAVLEEQRAKYLALARSLPNAEVVNANRDLANVKHDVVALIWRHYSRKQLWSQ